MNNLSKPKDSIIFLIIHTVMAILATFVTLAWFIEFSGYAFAYGKIVFAILFFLLIDQTLLRRFDTFTEIQNGNTAAGCVLIAYAILVAGALTGV
jgi:hypothetical protein